MIKYPVCDIIIIGNKLSTHVSKQINLLSNENKMIHSYVYDIFKIEIPKHSLCSPHSILSKEESDNLLNNELKIKKKNLAKIKINDPQIIWIGGKMGDIIKIERNSEITGKSIYYRVVI